jgi:quercetin dioxygenase-like cupin family protein
MNYIKLLAEINFSDKQKAEKNKEVRILLNNGTLQILEIKLFNGEILSKHSSPSPISVLCLSGNGIFKAGENLLEEQKLTAGTLLYLEKEIPHEVVAESEIIILVTKFSV